MNKEKSIILASQIEMIKGIIMMMDLGYLKEAANTFYDQGNWQDSAAVLNPAYDPAKSQLLRKQAETMGFLLSFAEGLKSCQELKYKVAEYDKARKEIAQMFF